MTQAQQYATHGAAVLTEAFAYYGHIPTQFEAGLWMKLVAQHGEQAVARFLQHHLLSSPFPPKLADAQRMLSPISGNDEAAFLRLIEEVRVKGPYSCPDFSSEPAIASAVEQLGGWAAVNAQLPDPSARFDYEAFQRRFAAAYQMARSHQVVQGPGTPRAQLRGLHALSAPSALPGAAPAANLALPEQGLSEQSLAEQVPEDCEFGHSTEFSESAAASRLASRQAAGGRA
jgi:hypothetical protein